MVRIDWDESGDDMQCEGCGERLPAFLDGCPYCDDDAGEGATLPCPLCGVEIYDGSEQCPVCGGWVTPQVGAPAASHSMALIVVVVLVVLILLMTLGRV